MLHQCYNKYLFVIATSTKHSDLYKCLNAVNCLGNNPAVECLYILKRRLKLGFSCFETVSPVDVPPPLTAPNMKFR